MLSIQSSCEAKRDKNTPLIPYRKSWLALSGRQIQLKHQGHVERVLGHPERLLGHLEPKNSETPTIKKKRNAKSAPPRPNSSVPLQRFAWCEGNKFVIQKVTKTFRNSKSPINLPDTIQGYHGYQSFSPTLELRSAEIHSSDVTKPVSEEVSDISEMKKSVTVDVAKESTKPIATPNPPLKSQEHDASSRPSSGTMPHPVRSVVIKIPKSDTMTPPAPIMTPSRPMMPQRVANSFPLKPTVRFSLRQKT